MKTLKRADECFCDLIDRGKLLSGEQGETTGWGNFNDENPVKRAEKCP